jgi:hypothetical protein
MSNFSAEISVKKTNLRFFFRFLADRRDVIKNSSLINKKKNLRIYNQDVPTEITETFKKKIFFLLLRNL